MEWDEDASIYFLSLLFNVFRVSRSWLSFSRGMKDVLSKWVYSEVHAWD